MKSTRKVPSFKSQVEGLIGAMLNTVHLPIIRKSKRGKTVISVKVTKPNKRGMWGYVGIFLDRTDKEISLLVNDEILSFPTIKVVDILNLRKSTLRKVLGNCTQKDAVRKLSLNPDLIKKATDIEIEQRPELSGPWAF